MVFVITRKASEPAADLPKVRLKDSAPTPHAISFKDDVKIAQSIIASMGYSITEKDAAALWRALSFDHYSVIGVKKKPEPGQQCWLVPGYMTGLIRKHGMEYLEAE